MTKTGLKLGLIVVLVCTVPASRGDAFSDPLSYGEQVQAGGGGGRWFTGSAADGFGCDVCHAGGEPAELEVRGLPLDGYVPGTPYEVTLLWPANVPDLALIAEFTDELRRGAGTLALPRQEALMPVELCSEEGQEAIPASELHAADAGRALVSVIDCGAKSVRFLWTAPLPPLPDGRLWFNVGFVASNQDAAPGGDGVTLVRRPLWAAGAEPGPTEVVQGCTLVRGGSRAGQTPIGGLAVLAAVWMMQRRRRRDGNGTTRSCAQEVS